jgi:hypothetical protein
VTVTDVAVNTQAEVDALQALGYVDVISTTASFSLNQASALGATKLAATAGTVTVTDVAVNTQAEVDALQALARVDAIDITAGGAVTLSQASALAATKLGTNGTVTVAEATISGASAISLAALNYVDVIDAGNNRISLTYAEYTSLNGAALAKVSNTDTVVVAATNSQDTISTTNVQGVLEVVYSLGTQTTTFTFEDNGDSGTFNDGDFFTAGNASSVDVLTFTQAVDVLNLDAFDLVSGERAASAVFRGDTRTVDDQTFSLVKGDYNAGTGVFTVNQAAGTQLLVLFDSNGTGGSVVQSGIVITGATSLLNGSTLFLG